MIHRSLSRPAIHQSNRKTFSQHGAERSERCLYNSSECPMSLRISRRDPFRSYIENHRIPDSTESCQTHGLWLFVRSASNSLWPDSVREIRRVWYSKANGKVAWDILGDWKRMIGLNKVFGNSMLEASYQSSMPWKSEISSGCESHSVARPERNQGSEVGKDPVR